MNLRNYQSAAVDRVMDALARRPILVAPTGSGKTTMGCEIVRRRGGRCLWVAHRRELILQAADALRRHGLRAGVIMPGEPETYGEVQVSSIQTMARRGVPAADLVVIDECHHATSASYSSVLGLGADVCGLTATPFRTDGRGLGEVFGEIVVAATVQELVTDGWLHAPRVYAGKSPNLRGVQMIAGDYAAAASADRMRGLEGEIVRTWETRALGKRTVVFAVCVSHSEDIVSAFIAAGHRAAHLDGMTPGPQRDAILAGLRDGGFDIVSNCMVLTEGWDLPALECAIIARPTASLCLHLQMVGRIMRAAEGKGGCLVLDHAGNHHVHGLVTRQIDYRLDGEKVGAADRLDIKRCPGCFLMVAMAETVCPECGHTFGRDRSYATQESLGVLDEFAEDYGFRLEIWNLLEAEREAMGYGEGWSAYRYRDRFNEFPIVVDKELVDTKNATKAQKTSVYAGLIRQAREKGYRPGWASHRYRAVFGVWPRGLGVE